jgi:hypothetical protein
MKMSSEQLSELSKKVQADRIKSGKHHFIGNSNPMKIASKNGKHHFSGERGSEHNRKMIENGLHPLIGGNVQRNAHLKLIKEGNHHTQKIHKCPHCGKVGKSNSMYRYHFDKCKERKQS